ncbi:MAG: hypothetical protein HKN67_07010, partial [Saprospiraceae bacterium]|nr:hypothetical protein [Saprospiraceae bacterium]
HTLMPHTHGYENSFQHQISAKVSSISILGLLKNVVFEDVGEGHLEQLANTSFDIEDDESVCDLFVFEYPEIVTDKSLYSTDDNQLVIIKDPPYTADYLAIHLLRGPPSFC